MNVKFVSTYGNLKIWKCINFTKFLIKVHLAENRKKRILHSFYEANISLIAKSDKDHKESKTTGKYLLS